MSGVWDSSMSEQLSDAKLEKMDEAELRGLLAAFEKEWQDLLSARRYREAESAKTRWENLRASVQLRACKRLAHQNQNEQREMAEAYAKACGDVNKKWDELDAQFEAEAHQMVSTMAAKHEGELNGFQDKMFREMQPRTPRWSPELLSLWRSEQAVAKQKQLAQAAKLKDKADEMERTERQAWEQARRHKIGARTQMFMAKQDKEMGCLQRRLQEGREERRRLRKADLDALERRRTYVQTYLSKDQKQIQSKAETLKRVEAEKVPEILPSVDSVSSEPALRGA